MLRLNIRHELPQIGMQITRGRLERAAVVKPQIHTNNQQASSNQWITQPQSDINTHDSQYVTGKRTMLEFARERGQKGVSDARQSTSRHTQTSWSRIDNGAKKGDDIASQYKSQIFSDAVAEMVFSLEWTHGAEIYVAESQITGEPDVGDVTAEIQTAPSAEIQTSQGGVRTYIENEGFLRQWVTEDYYDIYA
ncbi:MAG: hypothetical protein IJQ16_00650 [Selenomonadaceae bacterium]|nr:hypothetical protein [Selenomonadaceae bacterium]